MTGLVITTASAVSLEIKRRREPIYLGESTPVAEPVPSGVKIFPFWDCVQTTSGAVVHTVGTDGLYRVLYPEEPCPETISTSG